MVPFDQLTEPGRVRRLRRLAEVALAGYDLPSPRLVSLSEGESMTFRVEARGERFVLRLHRPGYQTPASVRSELTWLQALRREAGLLVPEPVPTRAGELATVAAAAAVPEARYCDLLRWLPGRFARSRLSAAAIGRAGEFLAALHDHGAAFMPPAGFVRPRWDGSQVFGRPLADALERVRPLLSAADRAVVLATVDRGRAAMSELGRGQEVFGLIHADFHPGNYLFHRGQVAAIDFDDCGWGHFLYDVAVALRPASSDPALRTALLAGYRRRRPLTVEHEALLPASSALRRLNLALWRVLRDNDAGGLRDFIADLRRGG